MMKITDGIKDMSDNVEVFWYKQNYKVIMFINGEPVSYITLDDEENDNESAREAASTLINGGGTKL